MLNQTVLTALNDQIAHELYSSYLYLSMAAHFEANNLPGFAKWMYIQSDEERAHAMKFFEFVNDRGGRVKLQALGEPPFEWQSPFDVFEHVLQHEQKVTSLIHTLYETAVKEKDYPTQVLLHWFIDEQVEEEKNASAILEQLRQVGDHQGILFNIDRHIGKRGED